MNYVDIGVSKEKSIIAVMCPFGEVILPSFEVSHTISELSRLADQLKSLDSETCVIMEPTGNYHTPVATLRARNGLYVSVVNAMLVYDSGNTTLRRANTDKKDAVKAGQLRPRPLDCFAEICPGGRYPALAKELLPEIPTVFQAANHAKEQPYLPAGHYFPWSQQTVHQPCQG